MTDPKIRRPLSCRPFWQLSYRPSLLSESCSHSGGSLNENGQFDFAAHHSVLYPVYDSVWVRQEGESLRLFHLRRKRRAGRGHQDISIPPGHLRGGQSFSSLGGISI